jgi:serine/threonine-protein kinase RsbT
MSAVPRGESDLSVAYVSDVQVHGRARGHGSQTFAIAVESDLHALIGGLHRMLQKAGCDAMDTARIVTAASELGHNLLTHARRGTLSVRIGELRGRLVCELVSEDRGPGIADTAAALRDHFTTGDGLGLGLPGIKRLMDEFHLTSAPGVGTRLVVRRWL